MFGESPWLDSAFGATDYGHRGVPNVYLSAPLLSSGSWNSAHFKNPTYDKLVAEYIGALDIGSQRAAAGKIQNLLLDETPADHRLLLRLPLAEEEEPDGRGPDRGSAVLEGRLLRLSKWAGRGWHLDPLALLLEGMQRKNF